MFYLPFFKNGCPIQEFLLLEPSWLGSNLNYYDQQVSPNCHTIFKKNTEALFFFKVRCEQKFKISALFAFIELWLISHHQIEPKKWLAFKNQYWLQKLKRSQLS